MAKRKVNLSTNPQDALRQLAEALSLESPDVIDLLRKKHGSAVDDLLSIAPTRTRPAMGVPNMRGARESFLPQSPRPMRLLPMGAEGALAPSNARFNQIREEVRAAQRLSGIEAEATAAEAASRARLAAQSRPFRVAKAQAARRATRAGQAARSLSGLSLVEEQALKRAGKMGVAKLFGRRLFGLATGPVGTAVTTGLFLSDLVGDANQQQMEGLLRDVQRGAEDERVASEVAHEGRLKALEGYSSAMEDLAYQRQRGAGGSGMSPELEAIVAGETARLASMQQPARIGAMQAISMAEGFTNVEW